MRKKTKERIKIMFMKSFDYLLSQFNSLNTLLRKKRCIAYVLGRPLIKFLDLWRGLNGRQRPPRPSCLI